MKTLNRSWWQFLLVTALFSNEYDISPWDPYHDIQSAEINIFIHRIAGTNGNNPSPITLEDALSTIDKLNEDFLKTPIMFKVIGNDEISDSYYIHLDSDERYLELVSDPEYSHYSYAIDVYFLPPEGSLGGSDGRTYPFPGQIYTVINGNYVNTSVITHEIGHERFGLVDAVLGEGEPYHHAIIRDEEGDIIGVCLMSYMANFHTSDGTEFIFCNNSSSTLEDYTLNGSTNNCFNNLYPNLYTE